ncbi:predicted protein [Aspergillus terreus NIH2624]|uniref:Uncharacterized protein n=1 Tax=Aspergillus terreus (strain NIH 2624 / FGSC A1156) TaxID=341663 RepID=Q0CET9_ASPTN|nr:uncharacterized protein ATEG_07795 [Aspergillus terreus NIH2624]EAU32057.1 predicted protein [Aspergillus terreus NIH2624]
MTVRMDEIRQMLEESGKDLETNKHMLEDLRRQLDQKTADNRNRKRSNPECLHVRQGIINAFVDNILHSPSPADRVPVKWGCGDVALDVYLYENRMRTDYEVFKELYGVEELVNSNCAEIQTVFDYMAEKRLQGAVMSPDLFGIFEDLIRSLQEMDEIPRRLDPRSKLSRACTAIKSELGGPDVNIFILLDELRAQPGYYDRPAISP